MSVKLMVVALLSAAGVCAAGVARANPLELSAGLGLGKPSGDNSDNFGPDIGGAISVGSRVHPNFGIHFRLAFDRLGRDEPPLTDASVWMGRLQLEPAAHVVQDRVDFSLGPTLGLYYLSGEFDGPGAADSEGTSRGFTFGARVNLMFLASADVAIGPYFSYDRLFPTQTCVSVATLDEACNDDPDEDQGFWQLGVAATF
jgi:Outer membrane protein beta-barrel domain